MSHQRRFGTLIACLLVAASAMAELKKQKSNLGPWEDEIGYAQTVRVGNTLYISGTVGAGAMPDAIKEAFSTLQKTLQAQGLTFQNVVKENIFTTDLEALKKEKAIRRAFYGTDFPAATWVQVQRLWSPDHVLEVELIAVFPDEAPAAPVAAPSPAPVP